ncbi:FecR domain-containing protein [Bradyrhizobium manausense]|nr:FecR domain-containing protein [Bradyrhizobium manausense]
MNYAGKFDAALSLDGQGFHSPAHRHVDFFSVEGHGKVPAGAFVVPDPNLIFHGDFKRAGVDLVLSRDGQEFVLHDYFKGEKRAAIASPDGAHLTGELVDALTGHVQYAQAAPGAGAGQVIGHVTKLTGGATAIRNGVSIILNNGDNVEKGDVVSTGSDATLGITFIDGTVFGLSANARMVLNEMVYDPNGSNNSSLLSLVAGTITFVAGETAKHGDMKIDTPVATMGIRGTAVLSQLEFFIPPPTIDNPTPQPEPKVSFQVLVEPDGTTGSYILFDKITLLPIATVNQAGQMIQISGGNVTIGNALLSPEVQKLITDVFTLKFTDNTNNNTKLTTNFTDTVTPDSNGLLFKTVAGAEVLATYVNTVNTGNNGTPQDTRTVADRIPGPPNAVVLDSNGQPRVAFTLTELFNKTGDTGTDSVGGRISFVDVNLGDRPTVQIDFKSVTYQNANHQDVTSGLSALQKADVAATEVKIVVTPDAGNTNNGSAQWSYSVPDKAFDFLAAGEVLTLTYMVRVDNNFSVNPETAFIPITITISGTNDKPVIATSVPTITFAGGTSVPGGPLTSSVPTSGTLTFTDVDLTDTHTVSVKLTSASLPGGTVPPAPLAAFQNALSVSLAGHDSTGSGTGVISWSLADLPVYLADFIPEDAVLTLTYTVTLTDSQGATSTQTITVTITGTDSPAVVWIATAQAGSPPGGFWKDGANWETGTVPTIDDDVIVITDQLHGLTPSYPVTIDEAAFAKSLTMNDFGGPPPEVINNSSLTIAGALNLSADSILTNSVTGTITVGGKAEILDTSVLTNAGQLTLSAGGDFGSQTTIANSGTLELAGGTLNLLGTVANTGGMFQVDGGATLALDSGTIDGGTVTIAGTLELDGSSVIKNGTLGNSGAVDVNGTAEFDNEAVDNAGGTITIAAAGALVLSGSTVTGGTVTDNGTIHVTGNSAINGASVTGGGITVDAAKTLTLNNTTVTNSTIIDNGTVKVDASKTLNINGVAVTGGALSVSGTLKSSGASSTTNTAITNNSVIEAIAGLLTLSATTSVAIANSGTLRANGGELDISGEAVTNTGTLAAINDSTLKLISTTVTNTGGTVSVESGSTLDLSGATITGGTLTISGTLESTGVSAINDADITNTGTITVTSGTLTIDPPVVHTITNQNVIEANGGTLDIIGDLIVNTATLQAINGGTLKLTNVTVTNAGGTVSTDGTSKLYLTGVSINDGTLSNAGNLYGVSGTNTITAAVTNTGTIEVQGGTLDLAGGLTGAGTLIIDDGATLALGGADAQTVTFAGGTDTLQLDKGAGFTGTIAGEASTGGTFTVTGNGNINSTKGDALDFTASGGTVGNAADVVLTPTGTLTGATNGIVVTQNGVGDISLTTGGDVTGLSGDGIVLHHGASGAGDITATIGACVSGAVGLDVLANGDGDVTITNNGTITGTTGVGIHVTQDGAGATGSTHITNTGAVVGADGEAAISIQENATGTALIDNSGTIGPDGAGTVTSTTVAILETGGAVTINNSGEINGNISVATATFNNEAGGTWTVSGTSVFGTLSTIDNAGTIDLRDGASIASADGLTFAITNSNAIDSWGTNSITGTITNTGTIEVDSGTLTLFGSLSGSGSVAIDADATLKLEGSVTQTVTFSGGNAELEIGTTSFDGTIAGLSSTDKIDLTTIKYDIGTTATYDAVTGELTVSDTYGHSITLKLSGDYSNAHFAGSDDGSGNTLITLNAADDVPAFDAAEASQSTSFAELDNTTGSSTTDPAPAATGTIHFTDIDLTDRPTVSVTDNAVTWTDADHSTDLSASLTSGQISAIEQALTLQQSGNTNNGAIGWTYSIADGALDFLGEDQTVTLLSTITLDDHQGGTDTAQVKVTITGKNDAPAITAESGDSTGATQPETNGEQTARGTLTLSDADVTDHVSVSLGHLDVYLDGVLQTDTVGGISHDTLATYLTLPSGDILDGTGTHAQFTWEFNSSGEAFDFLANGQTLSLQYTIVPSDGHTSAGTGEQVVTIEISGTNDAPTLDSATLASVVGNDSDPAGSTVSDLFAGKFHDADAGASLKAIAVTADNATATEGVWQYEVAGTSQWIDIGSVDDQHALVLSPDTLIRFVPADGFTGTPGTLGVHALDDTYAGAVTGASAVTIDLTSTGTGGTTPVSDTVATIGTSVTAPAGGPVIDTESFLIEHVRESIPPVDVITNLVVTDTDPGASTDHFTVTATTAHAPGSSVYLSSESGLLSEINLGFENGVTYDPGLSPPDTDQITLTVTDSAGRFDTVHFIFNEAGEGQGITLEGTDGKDVIFATESSDTLIGGAAKDQFVFAPGSPLVIVEHTVKDFEVGVDKIDLRLFDGVDSWTDVNKTQVGNDTVLTVEDHDTILLKNVLASSLSAGDFIVTNHGGGIP